MTMNVLVSDAGSVSLMLSGQEVGGAQGVVRDEVHVVMTSEYSE